MLAAQGNKGDSIVWASRDITAWELPSAESISTFSSSLA